MEIIKVKNYNKMADELAEATGLTFPLWSHWLWWSRN